MAALRGGAWNASADAVLDWLKHTPALRAPADVNGWSNGCAATWCREWSGRCSA
jgi:ATP-dependent helicase/nuclease subunit B